MKKKVVRNSVVMVFALLLFVSDAYSMLCLSKKLPRSSYYAALSQARHKKNGMRLMSGGEIIFGLMCLPGAAIFLGIPFLCGCAIVGGAFYIVGAGSVITGGFCLHLLECVKYKNTAYAFALKSDQCSQAYMTKSNKCVDSLLCCKNTHNYTTQVIDHLVKVDNGENWRLNYVSTLNDHYDKLNYVELAEIDNFNHDAQYKNIDLEKYRNTFGIIGQKKQCIYNMMSVLEDDMPNYQKKLEQLYSDRLGLVSLTGGLKDDVDKKIKKISGIIAKVRKEYRCPSKRPPVFKEKNLLVRE